VTGIFTFALDLLETKRNQLKLVRHLGNQPCPNQSLHHQMAMFYRNISIGLNSQLKATF
jgi:hypothetical protein